MIRLGLYSFGGFGLGLAGKASYGIFRSVWMRRS